MKRILNTTCFLFFYFLKVWKMTQWNFPHFFYFWRVEFSTLFFDGFPNNANTTWFLVCTGNITQKLQKNGFVEIFLCHFSQFILDGGKKNKRQQLLYLLLRESLQTYIDLNDTVGIFDLCQHKTILWILIINFINVALLPQSLTDLHCIMCFYCLHC